MVYKAAFRLICFFYGMFAVASSAGEMPQDLRFLRVWHGRSVLDDTLPFPDGLTFVPAADYAGRPFRENSQTMVPLLMSI